MRYGFGRSHSLLKSTTLCNPTSRGAHSHTAPAEDASTKRQRPAALHDADASSDTARPGASDGGISKMHPLAKHLDVHWGSIQNWERGVGEPPYATCPRLLSSSLRPCPGASDCLCIRRT